VYIGIFIFAAYILLRIIREKKLTTTDAIALLGILIGIVVSLKIEPNMGIVFDFKTQKVTIDIYWFITVLIILSALIIYIFSNKFGARRFDPNKVSIELGTFRVFEKMMSTIQQERPSRMKFTSLYSKYFTKSRDIFENQSYKNMVFAIRQNAENHKIQGLVCEYKLVTDSARKAKMGEFNTKNSLVGFVYPTSTDISSPVDVCVFDETVFIQFINNEPENDLYFASVAIHDTRLANRLSEWYEKLFSNNPGGGNE
jgi:hypothetical protein